MLAIAENVLKLLIASIGIIGFPVFVAVINANNSK